MPCPSGVHIPNVFRFYNAWALGGSLAGEFIRSAKDLQLTPAALAERLTELSVPLPLATTVKLAVPPADTT
mgnify:CR=1 FL=1